MKRNPISVWMSGFMAAATITAIMDRMSPVTIALFAVFSMLNWNMSKED